MREVLKLIKQFEQDEEGAAVLEHGALPHLGAQRYAVAPVEEVGDREGVISACVGSAASKLRGRGPLRAS